MARAAKVPSGDFDVVLTLSRQEAEALHDVLRRVGGSPTITRRKHTESVLTSLASLFGTMRRFDLASEWTGNNIIEGDLTGSLYFQERRI